MWIRKIILLFMNMKKLFTEEEFNNSKNTDILPLQCYGCDKTYYTTKKIIKQELAQKRDRCKYCSQVCHMKINHPIKKHTVKCKQCGVIFHKKNCSVIKTKNNNFCSSSCAATYNNQHKTTGTRVSKLEIWLKEQLTINYPYLEIHYNRKDAINSELDIYIPSLKLAFELNGIFHYEPIYGQEKLNQIQNNDDRKFQACLEKKIELVIIDSSSLKYFKLKNIEKYKIIILNLIEKKKTNT